jgi:2-C-methyl-D-erythritol 4-phosphate cytidylyltransferase
VRVAGVILAAGTGTRFGGRKQHELVAGVTVLNRAVSTAWDVCDQLVVVCNDNMVYPREHIYVPGGPTRSASVRCALDAIAVMAEPPDIIVVHDAARPLASEDLWRRTIAGVSGDFLACVPVVKIPDSIRRTSGQPADRDDFVIAQTPQAFQASVLFELHAREPECSDDAGLLTLGVRYVAGEATNIKITEPADVDVAAALLRNL